MKPAAVFVLSFWILGTVGVAAQTTYPSLTAEGNLRAVRIGNVNEAQAMVSPATGDTLEATLEREETTPHPDGWSLLTVVTGNATAGYGTLSGSLSVLAEDKPEETTTPLGSTLVNRTSCEVNGFLSVRCNDTITVSSSTLPAGTAVNLTITLALEAAGVGSSSPSPMGFAEPPYGMNAIGHIQFVGGNVRDFFHGVTTFTVSTQVGATLQFSAWLDLAAEAQGGWDIAAGTFYTKAEAAINASDTAHIYIDPPAGVTLLSGSGHSYASAPVPAGRLLNLSTRALAQTGDNILIPGFVVAGTANKRLLIRAVGPTLADPPIRFTGTVLPNPQLVLKKWNPALPPQGGYEDVTANDDWETNLNTADIISTSEQLSAFPLTRAADSALLLDLAPGQYTVFAQDGAGASGIAIVELYDADDAAVDSRLVNISNRGFCGVGDNVMIPGFVISSEGPRTVLVRVVGPTLAGNPYNVAGTMADPKLTLVRTENGVIMQEWDQDDWGDEPDAALTTSVAAQLSAFALATGSKDAAFVKTLAPGVYTVIASSADGVATGVVLVEVYIVP